MKSIILAVVIALIIVGGYYFYISNHQVYSQVQTKTTITEAKPKNAMVNITSHGFDPQTITIKAGEMVTWVNKSGSEVSINSNPHPLHTDYEPLNLGVVSNNSRISLVFPSAGTHGYHNHLNPTETGTVVVE